MSDHPSLVPMCLTLGEQQYRRGVEAACAIIEERGVRIRGAIQPNLTVREIRERLLSETRK